MGDRLADLLHPPYAPMRQASEHPLSVNAVHQSEDWRERYFTLRANAVNQSEYWREGSATLSANAANQSEYWREGSAALSGSLCSSQEDLDHLPRDRQKVFEEQTLHHEMVGEFREEESKEEGVENATSDGRMILQHWGSLEAMAAIDEMSRSMTTIDELSQSPTAIDDVAASLTALDELEASVAAMEELSQTMTAIDELCQSMTIRAKGLRRDTSLKEVSLETSEQVDAESGRPCGDAEVDHHEDTLEGAPFMDPLRLTGAFRQAASMDSFLSDKLNDPVSGPPASHKSLPITAMQDAEEEVERRDVPTSRHLRQNLSYPLRERKIGKAHQASSPLIGNGRKAGSPLAMTRSRTAADKGDTQTTKPKRASFSLPAQRSNAVVKQRSPTDSFKAQDEELTGDRSPSILKRHQRLDSLIKSLDSKWTNAVRAEYQRQQVAQDDHRCVTPTMMHEPKERDAKEVSSAPKDQEALVEKRVRFASSPKLGKDPWRPSSLPLLPGSSSKNRFRDARTPSPVGSKRVGVEKESEKRKGNGGLAARKDLPSRKESPSTSQKQITAFGSASSESVAIKADEKMQSKARDNGQLEEPRLVISGSNPVSVKQLEMPSASGDMFKVEVANERQTAPQDLKDEVENARAINRQIETNIEARMASATMDAEEETTVFTSTFELTLE